MHAASIAGIASRRPATASDARRGDLLQFPGRIGGPTYMNHLYAFERLRAAEESTAGDALVASP
ncbi:hypothetical protein [Xanthomonas graminis]|uniref:hypothetical protein n=1 Tax=Xanthomonas graminis TaxID=3390026 RepID=UPI000A66AD46|nr:hypothetical protein [Xanthomonas translucens]UKE74819.1 hypothetical protein KFS85_08040 [Xanthomonas translucens pv. phleipratensis]